MDDEEIVMLYNRRSERAIAETQTKYGAACYNVAFGILRSREDSEECVNDTYVRTWGAIPPNQPKRLGAFVCRITRNLALDRCRAAGAAKRSAVTESAVDELADSLPSWADGVEDRVVLTDLFNRFLSSLPPGKRMIFVRRYFYMDTPREIAKMLSMTETGVKMALFRMRKKLREELCGPDGGKENGGK